MQNNPNQEIHTDYRTDDVFKPVNANQLANSIHYDFVITQEMLDNYLNKHPSVTYIDIGNLIASDIDGNDGTWEHPVQAPVSIYIAAKTSLDDSFTFKFGVHLCNRSTSPEQHIVESDVWHSPNAEDLINVYSAYPYKVDDICGGINHWSTPTTRIWLDGNTNAEGICKIGSYHLEPGSTSANVINRSNSLMLVIQGSSDSGSEFVYPWPLTSSENNTEVPEYGNLRPSVVHANWMTGCGVADPYNIYDSSLIVNGLYAQIKQTIQRGSEPSLTIQHSRSMGCYQFSGISDYVASFYNMNEQKVVTISSTGRITWKNVPSTGGRNLIDIGWLYKDTTNEGGNMVPDSRNPASNDFIPQIDTMLSQGITPFVMYTCFNNPEGGQPVPADPSIDYNTNVRTFISPLYMISYCSYYFTNPTNVGYVVRLHADNKISLSRSNVTPMNYYEPSGNYLYT